MVVGFRKTGDSSSGCVGDLRFVLGEIIAVGFAASAMDVALVGVVSGVGSIRSEKKKKIMSFFNN